MKNRMAYDYFEFLHRAENWAKQAHELGWIQNPVLDVLPIVEQKMLPESDERPLIVAFMGGTGVGKSALLNRLAGKPIAKSGVARPTSKEVTLFHHQSVTLSNLPVDSIRVESHQDSTQKNIIWIDMPDFDSTDARNKELVLRWLPQIDLLIYVVSPERYRDEKAWRLLLSEGARHGWVFVMNQWDRGQDEQLDDFKKQVQQAGFDAPLIFKTCCIESIENDEFHQLSETLISLATQKTISELTERGTQLHVQFLKKQLQNYLFELGVGNETRFVKLKSSWQTNWKKTAQELQKGFAWRIQPIASQLAQQSNELLPLSSTISLWDDWAQTRFNDALNTLMIDTQVAELPVLPLENSVAAFRNVVKKEFNSHIELQARQALAQRGNIVQRGLLKLVAVAEIVLPISAMSWVGFQVVNGYYESNQTHLHYLNLDFAIHSILLCGLAWVFPYFILKKCQPSLEKCAKRGLKIGISQSLDNLNAMVLQAIEQMKTEKLVQTAKLNGLLSEIKKVESVSINQMDENNPLKRLLVENQIE